MTYDQQKQLEEVQNGLKWLAQDLQECTPNRFPIQTKSWARWKQKVAELQGQLLAVLAAYNQPVTTSKAGKAKAQAEEVTK